MRHIAAKMTQRAGHRNTTR